MRNILIKAVVLIALILLALLISAIPNFFNKNVEKDLAPGVPEKILQVYSGVIPCADCEGIQTEISFLRYTASQEIEGDFALQELYVGKSEKPISSEGKWSVEILPTGKTVITLNPEKTKNEQRKFLLEDESILMLDVSGNVIQSNLNYRLNRL